MSVLAIVPARKNSRGIPNKNFRELCGMSPLHRAVECALRAGLNPLDIIITTDSPHKQSIRAQTLQRPPELAQDDTPMVDVVRHVLEQIPGPPDQPIILLQPTQPLREPKHITQALALLTPEVDSVVSVVEICPAMQWVLVNDNGLFVPLCDWVSWATLPTRRQGYEPAYKADGTVYAFWRKSVRYPAGLKHGNFYGRTVKPLIIPAHESCALDTPEDWTEAERRLKAREHVERQNL